MASETEPAKLLIPYLQRADELQKHEPLVAYYCRLYAMEKGLKIPQGERTKTTSALLISIMNQLEKDKKAIKLGPEDNLYIEGFALNVFGKADKEDHAGRADLNTAKTFYAASIFFEILNQFGVLQPDLEQKQKYAVWKAADIRKALKEGRKPTPGPPTGDKIISILSNSPSNTNDLGTTGTPVTSPGPEFDPSHDHDDPVNSQHLSSIHPAPEFHDQPYSHPNYPSHETPSCPLPHFQSYPSFADSSLPSVPSSYTSYTHYQGSDAPYSTQSVPLTTNITVSEPNSTTQTYQYDSNYQPPPEKIVLAHKAAKFATNALQSDDVPAGVDFLMSALDLLTNPSFGHQD